MKKKLNLFTVYLVLTTLLVVTACSSGESENKAPVAEEPTAEQSEGDEEKESEQEAPIPDGLTDATRAIEITTSDGRILTGTFYPAANLNAPVVILMHWVMGNETDWTPIAYWLQNRGLADAADNNGGADQNMPWLDSSWFPTVPADRSYNVLTFNFYKCEDDGCMSFDRGEWLLDSQAAYETARTLEGVDPTRMVGIGASIGADGVADGCLYINSEYPDTCQGALSLSAGSYLTVDYKEVVAQLNMMEPVVPVQCFYAAGDSESATVCGAITEEGNYTAVKYAGNEHGMMLIQPDLEHDTLTLILQFLDATIGAN